MKHILIGLIFALSVIWPCTPVLAQATSSCMGYSSYGNPYPCCNQGNCTWWAWKCAKDNWGQSLGVVGNSWGNPNSWLARAQSNHFGVSATPAPGTVAVNSYVNGTGHAAWVYAVDSFNVYVTEMNCNITSGMRYYQYPITWFNGYISKKPSIGWMYPQPTWSSYDRCYTLYGSGFKANPTVKVTFPSGGSGNLSGAQIPYVDSGQMSMIATFGTPGWYSLQVRNSDGGWSDPWWVYVM